MGKEWRNNNLHVLVAFSFIRRRFRTLKLPLLYFLFKLLLQLVHALQRLWAIFKNTMRSRESYTSEEASQVMLVKPRQKKTNPHALKPESLNT
jgi:hypothetical protein